MNSYDFQEVYKSLSIEIPKLGVVMLDTLPLPVLEYIDDGEKDLYVSKHPDRFWINGAVAEHTAHATLLYGLLEKGHVWKEQIDQVLDGWTPPALEIDKVTFFPSTFEDEPYACIIAKVKVTKQLLEGHQRLSFLPHINTFPEYTPHITLAYVKDALETRRKWVNELNYWLSGRTIEVTKINLGKGSE